MAIRPEQDNTFPHTYSIDTDIDPAHLNIVRALEHGDDLITPRPEWRRSVVRRFLQQVEPLKGYKRLMRGNISGKN